MLSNPKEYFMHLIFEKTTAMKKAVLVHNPTAGSADHKKADLKNLVKEMGYEVKYYSTDSLFWKRFLKQEAEVIFVAGGDGTVQKLAKAMLEAQDDAVLQVPVRVLPCGTANNIATSLQIKYAEQVNILSEKKAAFDIGVVQGKTEASFFIEGMGCGIFPALVKRMEAKDDDKIQDEIRESRRELLKIIESYKAQQAIIIADKEEITGSFLLVELLNIRFIGPNIELAPKAQSGDGNFELVIIREDARHQLKKFIEELTDKKELNKSIDSFAEVRRVKEIRLKWGNEDVHLDDELHENYRGEEIKAENRQAIFNFLVPE